MRTHNICLYKKVNKKYTGCNKTTEFHECALIGVCAVIRSNTVSKIWHILKDVTVAVFANSSYLPVHHLGRLLPWTAPDFCT